MSEQNVVIGAKKTVEPPIPVDTEFKVPTDTVELPSKGLFYPNNKSSVTIKYMTASSDNILFSEELIRGGKVLDVLLEESIVDKDLRPNDMLSADRNFLIIQIRKTGLGSEYKPGGDVKCKNCDNSYKPTVDLDKLKTKTIDAEPDEKGEYTLELPMTKATIKFRFLKGSDEKFLAKVMEHGQKTASGMKVSNIMTERYLLQFMEVNGNRDKTYIKKFVAFMPPKDSIFFRIYCRNIEPGIDLNYEFECPSCGHSQTQMLEITSRLFYPDPNEESGENS